MNCKITWMLGQEPLVFLLTEWLVGTFSYCRAAQLSPPRSLKMKEKVERRWMASEAAQGVWCREWDKAVRVLWPGE